MGIGWHPEGVGVKSLKLVAPFDFYKYVVYGITLR